MRWFALVMVAGCTEVGLNDTSKGPGVELVLPVDGGRFDPALPVQVCAAIDTTADLSRVELVLASDVDGILATSGFTACDGGDLGIEVSLTDAPHVLSLTATDVQGRTGSDTTAISPLANTPPSCQVLTPAANALVPLGEPLSMSIRVDDPEGGPLEVLVTSSAQGDIAAASLGAPGTASVSATLDAGPHDLVVTVDDARGAEGVCVVSVEVVPCRDLDGDGVETCDGDCDDADPTTYPGAPEVPDGRDNDCDGAVDEGTALADDDGDGFSELDGDCDDGDAGVFPGQVEVPDDGIDQDCDGDDTVTCYVDGDDDGYGSAVVVLAADGDCDDPGEATVSGDCDDTDASRNPGATDVPDDGVDQDCSGADDASCFTDGDGDGWGTTAVLAADGSCDAADGEATQGGDCLDTNASVHPGATEIPGDGIDQDCSGADRAECFVDMDRDGYGTSTVVFAEDGSCDTPQQEAEVDGDCNDANAAVHPGADDSNGTDGIDADCDGVDGQDNDGDGVGSGTDCDDDDADVYPGATELRNGADDDCDGLCDEGLIGFGDLVITELMIDPTGGSDLEGEWFELYNPTSTDIVMCSGWSFEDDGIDFWAVDDPTLTVPANGYIVAGASANPALNGGTPVDHAYVRDQMILSNNGDEVVIRFDGVLIDRVAWSTAFDTADRSQQLDPSAFDATSNDDTLNNWCDSTTSWPGGDGDFGSPGAPNEVCP
ncbi:MAG: MopE-related protein [Myxococcota bacterium]